MIHDPVLTDLVQQQTEKFNSDAPEQEKVALLEKIQKRQKELVLLE